MMKYSCLFLVSGFAACIAAQEYAALPASCGNVSATAKYPDNAKLPDPFLKADGTRITTKEEWLCKRAEIRQQMQNWELGAKPQTAKTTATMSGSTISITVTDGGKSISFSVTVKAPTTKPGPAVIALGGPSVPIAAGVGTITYNNQDIAADDPHGVGKFYTIYGSNHPAGGLIAWAWGVSRIVDALEQLGADKTGIDPKKLGVTGCSRNGKGALISAAFDDRIALGIPQEGGSGGAGCWRIVNDMKKNGTKVEDSTQIVKGDGWFSPPFIQTAQNVNVLPYDHHMLMALVAPRGLIVIENSGIDYLGPPSTLGCSLAAKMVFGALGVDDNMGISQTSHGSSHCQLPSSQNSDVLAFQNKFLLGQSATTNFVKSDISSKFSIGQWVTWTAPALK